MYERDGREGEDVEKEPNIVRRPQKKKKKKRVPLESDWECIVCVIGVWLACFALFCVIFLSGACVGLFTARGQKIYSLQNPCWKKDRSGWTF